MGNAALSTSRSSVDGFCRPSERRQRVGVQYWRVFHVRRQHALVVARGEIRMRHARSDVRVEAARMLERGDRRVEQATVAACLNEPCEELGVARAVVGATNQAQHRCFGLPELDFEVGVEVVRDRQVRIQLEGSCERRLRLLVVILRGFARVHPENAMDPTKTGPRRREVRILRKARAVQDRARSSSRPVSC